MRLLAILLLSALPAVAQSTNISAQITDTDSQTWNNGRASATFVPGPISKYNWTGGTIPQSVNATMNGSGTFTMSLPDNSLINPVGSAWLFSICPNASAPCVSKQITVTGASMNLSAQLSAIAQGPRFPASASAYGYLDVEVAPTPTQGGFYWNVTNQIHRQWTGSVWQDWSGGGGGGSPPCGAVGQVQLAPASGTSFDCSPNLTFTKTTNTELNKVNSRVTAFERMPRNEYDPMNTAYCNTGGTVCGLAAALTAGGSAPTQVIQAAMDYGRCQYQLGLVANPMMRIPLPPLATIPITGLKLWASTDFGGYSMQNEPTLQHTDSSQPMISAHSGSDTLTCNGTPYTPGAGNELYIHDFLMSGMGSVNSDNDVGIVLISAGSFVSEIGGVGTPFGSQGILDGGLENFWYRLGYPASQIAGCTTYTLGVRPVSGAPGGIGYCGAIQAAGGDNEVDYTYSTDAAQQGAHNACYPNCAAFIGPGNSGHATEIFSQVSDIDIIIPSNEARLSDLRTDGTSRESIRIPGAIGAFATGVNNIITNINGIGPCTDPSLQSNYNSGIATNCFGIVDQGQGNTINGFQFSTGGAVFGNSYIQAFVDDTGSQNIYSNWNMGILNANNTGTANDWIFYGVGFNANAFSSRATFADGPALPVNGATANVTGTRNIQLLASGTPLTNMIGGISQQDVTIVPNVQGVGGTSISPSSTIQTCTGLPVSGLQVTKWHNVQGVTGNVWVEQCDPADLTPADINWAGNPTPSNGHFLDLYGNAVARQIPNPTISVSLFGTGSAGQACFEQETTFPDNSYIVSNVACTNTDLTHINAGSVIRATTSSQASSYILYLVSNTQGNGVPLGAYPPPVVISGITPFWDGPTTIAAGGDGSTPPATGDNYTGVWDAPFGLHLNTTTTQPTCNALRQGLQWVVRGGGTAIDVLQQCIQNAAGSYVWQNLSPSGTATVIDYSGGAAVSTTNGTGLTSATCVNAPCTTARGNYTIVGGTATTGTILTINFQDTPTSTLTCQVNQEGNTGWFGLSHTITGTSMAITAANTIAGATFQVSYTCAE